MNALSAVAIAGFVGVALIALLLGLRRRSTRRGWGGRTTNDGDVSIEALEAEDLAQLLAAHNARRVARGEPEQSIADIERLLEREWVELAGELARHRRSRGGGSDR